MRKFILFGICGVINTSVDWSVYYTLTKLFDISPYLSKIIATVAGIFSAYILNSLWVFRKSFLLQIKKSEGRISKTIELFLKFISIYSIGMLANFVIFSLLIYFNTLEIVALFCATFISLLFNFFLIKRSIYKE